MKRIWKTICGAVFVLAMALLVMPVVNVQAAENYGDVPIYLNDSTEAYGTVEGTWIEENLEEPQIFSVASKSNNGKASYVIAQGVSLEKLLQKAGLVSEGIEGELNGATFGFRSGTDTNVKNPISYDYLIDAKKVMTSGGAAGEDTREDTGKEVTPILAVSYSNSYSTYEEAEAAAKETWENTLSGYRFVCGMTGESYTYDDAGTALSSSKDMNAKYSIANVSSIIVTTAKATEINLDSSLQLKGVAGKTEGQLTANVEPASASLATAISWKSSDETIATVDEKGNVKSVDYGTCQITVTIDGTELRAACEVSVVPPDLEIYLDDQKKATIDGAWMLNNMEENPQIYSVSNGKSNGAVKYLIAQGVSFEDVLKKAGIVQESMKDELEGASVEVVSGSDSTGKVISYEQLVADKVMQGMAPTGGVDVRTSLEYTVTPIVAVYYNKKTTYSTYAAAEEAVKEGDWKDVSNTYCSTTGMSGEAYVFTDGKLDNDKSNDLNWKYHITNTVKIVVHSAEPTAITLDKTELTFDNSKAQKVTATLAPATAANSKVTWTSSDENVAVVSSDGTVTPVAKGTCTITASVSDKVTATVSVTVNELSGTNQSVTTETEEKVTITKAVSVSCKNVKITWSKVRKADGYTVYRATSNNGKYEEIKTVSKKVSSYTDTEVKTGKEYFYKVAAYTTKDGKKTYDSKSAAKSVKVVPAAVSKVTAKNVPGKKAKLTWKKVDGATGYVVYRATKAKGKYTKVATVKSKSLKFTDSKLKRGKTYYYKVRAYKLVGKDKVYGEYSDVKKVAVKK